MIVKTAAFFKTFHTLQTRSLSFTFTILVLFLTWILRMTSTSYGNPTFRFPFPPERLQYSKSYTDKHKIKSMLYDVKMRKWGKGSKEIMRRWEGQGIRTVCSVVSGKEPYSLGHERAVMPVILWDESAALDAICAYTLGRLGSARLLPLFYSLSLSRFLYDYLLVFPFSFSFSRFVHSLTSSFIHSLAHSFTHWPIHSLTGPFIHALHLSVCLFLPLTWSLI